MSKNDSKLMQAAKAKGSHLTTRGGKVYLRAECTEEFQKEEEIRSNLRYEFREYFRKDIIYNYQEVEKLISEIRSHNFESIHEIPEQEIMIDIDKYTLIPTHLIPRINPLHETRIRDIEAHLQKQYEIGIEAFRIEQNFNSIVRQLPKGHAYTIKKHKKTKLFTRLERFQKRIQYELIRGTNSSATTSSQHRISKYNDDAKEDDEEQEDIEYESEEQDDEDLNDQSQQTNSDSFDLSSFESDDWHRNPPNKSRDLPQPNKKEQLKTNQTKSDQKPTAISHDSASCKTLQMRLKTYGEGNPIKEKKKKEQSTESNALLNSGSKSKRADKQQEKQEFQKPLPKKNEHNNVTSQNNNIRMGNKDISLKPINTKRTQSAALSDGMASLVQQPQNKKKIKKDSS